MVFIGVDLDQLDKMAPRRAKSAPEPIELNQHFGAKTDLLDLECGFRFKCTKQIDTAHHLYRELNIRLNVAWKGNSRSFNLLREYFNLLINNTFVK